MTIVRGPVAGMVSAADNKLFSVFLEPSHGRGDGSVLTRVVLTRQYYAEGTTIGTLLLGIGGITRNIIGDVTGNGTLAFRRHAAFALGLCASITGAAATPAEALSCLDDAR